MYRTDDASDVVFVHEQEPVMVDLRRGLLLRLPLYYHSIREQFVLRNEPYISSSALAADLGIDDTQVRKDLSSIGVKGRPRVGFNCQVVLQAIREILGFEHLYDAVIIGVGRLGGALACYQGFHKYGMNVVNVFDVNPESVGTTIGSHTILPMEEVATVIREKHVSLAVLTIPSSVAQSCAETVVAAGVRAIWNFAPTLLHVPDSVFIRNEHLSVGLSELSYHLKAFREKEA